MEQVLAARSYLLERYGIESDLEHMELIEVDTGPDIGIFVSRKEEPNGADD